MSRPRRPGRRGRWAWIRGRRPRWAGGPDRWSRSEKSWAELVRARLAGAGPTRRSGPSAALAPGAALQLDRTREQPERLAAQMAPYGFVTTAAAGGAFVFTGEQWPTVVLRPGARAVVSAPYLSEWGAAGSALPIAEMLDADVVFSHDDDGVAVPLAAALAQRRGRPHIIVRGTERPLGAEVLALGSPQETMAELPRWIHPLRDRLAGRLTMTGRLPVALGMLRAFPAGDGRVNPTVLLWLSPQARRVLSGTDQLWWTRPDVVELMQRRGVPLVRGDALGWLAAGRGAPSGLALERAEMLARTTDVAQLSPRAAEARLALMVDEAHGLTGFSVEQGSRRALVLAGDRREERAPIRRRQRRRGGAAPRGSHPAGDRAEVMTRP